MGGGEIDAGEKDWDKCVTGYPTFVKSINQKDVDRQVDMNTTGLQGPAKWRQDLTSILENLVEGRETTADLDKMNDYLFTMYFKKKSENDDFSQRDFHDRMAKELRKRQFDIIVRSKSKSPQRKIVEKQIIEP